MNIYQMYAHGGHRVGFWIVRDSWGNTLAQVTEIEGVTDGQKLKGRSPYYGNPKVFASFYNTSGKLLNERSEVSCPGTYAYDLIQPSPELFSAVRLASGVINEAEPATQPVV